MIDSNQVFLPLPQALAGALRRLAQLDQKNSWAQWATQRLTPTQRRILQLLGSRNDDMTLSAVASEIGVQDASASRQQLLD